MVPKVFRKSHFEFMSHILNLVTEIAETNQAKAIDAKFAKTRENSENRLFLKF